MQFSISFDTIRQIFASDLRRSSCIEIGFYIKGTEKYRNCWMGKKSDGLYWFGLVPDGSEAYDYNSFGEMSEAQVFEGSSLKELWNSVVIHTVDGCEPEIGLGFYL